MTETVLDALALLALLRNEPGAAQVAGVDRLKIKDETSGAATSRPGWYGAPPKPPGCLQHNP